MGANTEYSIMYPVEAFGTTKCRKLFLRLNKVKTGVGEEVYVFTFLRPSGGEYGVILINSDADARALVHLIEALGLEWGQAL